MASVLSHPAVPLALGIALGPERVPPVLLAAGCVASVLPDVDAVGFAGGIPYGHTFGHRGFTHSLFFAAAVALLAMPVARRLGTSPVSAFAFLFVSVASHGLLDAMTTGGLGIAFFSPFSNERFFLPWRRIAVSPIGITSFLSRRGLHVLASELVWIWAPCALLAGLTVAARRVFRLG
jgi:inner membrane protein